MQQFFLFVLLGLGSGAMITGLALAVIVSYRGSGVVNLATGANAMLSGFAFWALRTGELGIELATVPALIATLIITLAIGCASEFIVYRPLRNSPPLAKLVASLGILLIAQATMLLAFGTSPKPQPSILPAGTVEVFGTIIPVNRFILAGIVLTMAVALAALYRFTTFGLRTRAAAESELTAMLNGLSANELALSNTLLAHVVAGSVGILGAAVTQLDTLSLPLLVVPAVAAALLARLSSFMIAAAAGMSIGIMNSLIDLASTKDWFPTAGGQKLPGVRELLVFAIIVLAMYWRGRALPERGEFVEQGLPSAPRANTIIAPATVVLVVAAVALVVLPFGFRQALINTMVGTVMALSLVVITGFVGQVSVAQLALAGASAFAVSKMAVDAGLGFPLGPIAGVSVALVLGLLVGISALRVRGVSLAVVTLGATVAIYAFGFNNDVWGGGADGSAVPSPEFLGIELGPQASFRGLDDSLPSPVFGWLVLVVAVGVAMLVAAVRRHRFGQQMLAVRSNERAAASAGIDVRRTKLAAFALSSMIAGIAGVLYAYNFGSVSAIRFDAVTALALITFAYVGGISRVSGAVFAGFISPQALMPHALEKWFGLSGNWFLLFGGVLLIVTLLQHPDGMASTMSAPFSRRRQQVEPVGRPVMSAEGAVAEGAMP